MLYGGYGVPFAGMPYGLPYTGFGSVGGAIPNTMIATAPAAIPFGAMPYGIPFGI